MLIHAHHGHKLLLRLLYARFKDKVIGYPPTKSKLHEDDVEMRNLLGTKHDPKAGLCACNLCKFNNRKSNLRGEQYCIMVISRPKKLAQGTADTLAF